MIAVARGTANGQRAAPADGHAVRPGRPARARPHRGAPGDARAVPDRGRRVCTSRCSRSTRCSSRPPASCRPADYEEAQRLADEARAAGVRSHGVNAEVAYAGFAYRMALDHGRLAALVPDIERLVSARPLRTWQIARLRSLVEVDQPADARPLLGTFVDTERLLIGENQMFLPSACTLVEVADALGDRERASVLQHALDAVRRARRGGWPGRLLCRAGQRLRRAGGARRRRPRRGRAVPAPGDRRERRPRHAPARGPRPSRPRAHPPGPRRTRRSGRGGGEVAAARQIADEIGLVLTYPEV